MIAFNAYIDDKAAGMMSSQFQYTSAGIILCMRSAIERWRYVSHWLGPYTKWFPDCVKSGLSQHKCPSHSLLHAVSSENIV